MPSTISGRRAADEADAVPDTEGFAKVDVVTALCSASTLNAESNNNADIVTNMRAGLVVVSRLVSVESVVVMRAG